MDQGDNTVTIATVPCGLVIIIIILIIYWLKSDRCRGCFPSFHRSSRNSSIQLLRYRRNEQYGDFVEVEDFPRINFISPDPPSYNQVVRAGYNQQPQNLTIQPLDPNLLCGRLQFINFENDTEELPPYSRCVVMTSV